MKQFLLLITCCLIGCVSTEIPESATESLRKPNSPKVYKPIGEWNIRKESDLSKVVKMGAKVKKKNGIIYLNLNGITLDGSKQKGDGGQSENQTPLLRARIPLVVENGFIDNNKNALVFYAPNSGVRNLTWLDVGEDAVATFDGAKNFFVRNCEFKGAEDKSIQLNEADGAQVFDNTIIGGLTGVRLGKIDYTESKNTATCGGNKFIAVDTAWNCAKLVVTVENSNSYENVKNKWILVKGAKIKNKD